MNLHPIYDIWRILDHPRDDVEAEIRAHCQTAYIGQHSALCRVLGRYKIYVDTRDIGIASHFMLDGFWEMWVTAAMMQAIRRGSIVADIGANLGYFTLLMADLTGSEGRVLSFEPNPNMTKHLKNSIAVNGFGGFTTLHEVALGSAEGEVMMEIDESTPGGGRALTEERSADRKTRQARMSAKNYYDGKGTMAELLPDLDHEKFPVRRFDEIDGALDVEFMKMDVEGFEPHVWAGMTKLLDRKRPLTVFMEFTIERLDDAIGFLDEILSHGFSLEIIDHQSGVQPIDRRALFAQPHNIDHMLVFRR